MDLQTNVQVVFVDETVLMLREPVRWAKVPISVFPEDAAEIVQGLAPQYVFAVTSVCAEAVPAHSASSRRSLFNYFALGYLAHIATSSSKS